MTNEELLKVIEEAKASEKMTLDLSDKGITSLPRELCQLASLKVLILSGNQLASLPPEIYQLRELQKLYLWENKLTALPPEICQLSNLTELYLSYNQLTSLPPEICQLQNLTELNLSGNQLASLPPEICQLSKLKYLLLNDNPLVSPPYDIAEQGIEAIRKYFVAPNKGPQPLNEVKILLIGDGAAGKTSLVKQLVGQRFDKNEDTTQGISIKEWKQEVGGRQIRINIWDFGGQETQHATHQFFLSKCSLYVLVLDGRKDERTEYWLRQVEAFGGSSPVLIVLNKMDSNPAFDVNRPFLLEKYPSIRAFFPISCKSGKGVAEFKAALLEELKNPYISAEQYKGICQEAGITTKGNCELLVPSSLHDLGVAVHFKDFIPDAMHVLDQVWDTEAVYKIITAESMANSKGVLYRNTLKEILKEQSAPRFASLRTMLRLPYTKRHCCPPDTHYNIMGLMEKFELCYPFGEDAVLIPQLLPVSEPEFTFKQDGSLRFALHYPDFLPPSVFPRFMVKAHRDIHTNTCWRTGVLLEDQRSGAQALVKADVEARRINIWVQGEQRREYLHYLRYLLADINSGFEKLAVSERVPMPDAPHLTADYQTLLNYAKEDMPYYIPEGTGKKYSVYELLELVQPKGRDELVGLIRKVSAHLDDKESGTEIAASLFELKPNIGGIGFNLHELFARILVWAKQRQQQARR